MAVAQAKPDATEDRLAALALPEGGWSASARADALPFVSFFVFERWRQIVFLSRNSL